MDILSRISLKPASFELGTTKPQQAEGISIKLKRLTAFAGNKATLDLDKLNSMLGLFFLQKCDELSANVYNPVLLVHSAR